MKVRVVLVGLLAVSWVSAQAPYPPSGYKPPGRQFTLPARPTDNQGFGSGVQPQNQYVPPPNQYGAPDNRPQNTEAPPPSQYLPGLQPTDFRYNVGQTNRQGQTGQRDFSNQDDFSGQNQQQDSSDQQFGFAGQQTPQQQYGLPNQNLQQQQLNQNLQQQQLNQNRQQQQLNQNRQQYYRQQSYLSQSKNTEQQSFIAQGYSDQNQGIGAANVNNRQRPLPRTSASERNYLAPSNFENTNQQSRNFGIKQNARQQLYQTPQNSDEDSVTIQNDDQAFSGNDDQNLNVANQNYLPPTTTEGRRNPEPITRRPDTQEAAEPEENEAENPNTAIAMAVARGQYYLWQADGRLQRVLYKTTQTADDLKNNAYSAKLVYQPVQPITAPIYTYGAPLVRLNY